MDSYLHESATRKGELMGIHSHIQLPNSILQHFREGTDPERKVWYLDMHSGLIQRKSAKKLGTSKGYFSDLIERFWNQQVESPISELNCRVRNFCRGKLSVYGSPRRISILSNCISRERQHGAVLLMMRCKETVFMDSSFRNNLCTIIYQNLR